MIKVGIIGSTGYAGQEIVRILLGHNCLHIYVKIYISIPTDLS